ncbi:hypothetical protein [Nioella sp.]|uniref:hypothetical protein n=1 Tax=Nioella sp. TaxID=1912091 RepID=UPI003B5166BD
MTIGKSMIGARFCAVLGVAAVLVISPVGAMADQPEMGCSDDEYYVFPNPGATRMGLPTGCVPKDQLGHYWSMLQDVGNGIAWVFSGESSSGTENDPSFTGMMGGMR